MDFANSFLLSYSVWNFYDKCITYALYFVQICKVDILIKSVQEFYVSNILYI